MGGVVRPVVRASETPARVANRMEDRPLTSPPQVVGFRSSGVVDSMKCAAIIPMSARPLARSMPRSRWVLVRCGGVAAWRGCVVVGAGATGVDGDVTL